MGLETHTTVNLQRCYTLDYVHMVKCNNCKDTDSFSHKISMKISNVCRYLKYTEKRHSRRICTLSQQKYPH